MGLVLSQLSSRQNQDMPSTRGKAKNGDGNAASNSLVERSVRGQISATKNNTTSEPTNENKEKGRRRAEKVENISLSNHAVENTANHLKQSKKIIAPKTLSKKVKTLSTRDKKIFNDSKQQNACGDDMEDDECDSDKENELMDDKENDQDWNPDLISEPSPKIIPPPKRAVRKPLGELITLLPEESDLSEYEKLRLKRIAEQRVMLDAMKKASICYSNSVIPRPTPRRMTKVRSAYLPTRKDPPLLRSKRTRHNSNGSSVQSSETGETDHFVYLPATGRYDLYSDDEDEEFRPKKRSKAQRKREVEPLSEEERNNLKDFEMEEFEEFLRTVPHGRKAVPISTANARTVIRQVKLMVSGAGVGYHHWPSDIFWRKGEPVKLKEDFDQLKVEGIQMENRHGKDLGNGWLLNHPLQKLQNFQKYLYAKENS